MDKINAIAITEPSALTITEEKDKVPATYDEVFLEALRNRKLLSLARETKRDITLATGPIGTNTNSTFEIYNTVKLSPDGKILVSREKHYGSEKSPVIRNLETKIYGLVQTGGEEDSEKLVDKEGHKLAENYESLFPGRPVESVYKEVKRNINSALPKNPSNAH